MVISSLLASWLKPLTILIVSVGFSFAIQWHPIMNLEIVNNINKLSYYFELLPLILQYQPLCVLLITLQLLQLMISYQHPNLPIANAHPTLVQNHLSLSSQYSIYSTYQKLKAKVIVTLELHSAITKHSCALNPLVQVQVIESQVIVIALQ